MKAIPKVLVILLGLCLTHVLTANDAANIIDNGDFESPGGAGWELTGACRIVSGGDGNNYLKVAPAEHGLMWAQQIVPLEPEWRKLKLTTRVKVENLEPGPEGWMVAKVAGAFQTDDGKVLGYLEVAIKEDADWKEYSAEGTIPAGATHLRVNPGNFGKDGTVSIDDIRFVVIEHEKTEALAGRTIYVNASAAAGGDGSEAKPFRTIQGAADVAKAGDTILIHSGTYRETVVPKNSGKRGGFITFKPVDGAKVIVSGADPVTSTWTKGGKGVWTAPISGEFQSVLNQAEQLIVNGRMMVEARFPNLPFDSLDLLRPKQMFMDRKAKQHGASPDMEVGQRVTIYDDQMTAPDGTYDGATMNIWPRHGNGDQGGGWGFVRPAHIVKQTKGELLIDFPGMKTLDWWNKHHMLDGGEPYIITMHESCLDAPGEWLRKGDQLLLVPTKGVDPNQATVEIKRRDYAFNLTDRSYIRIDGLKIVAATITTDHASGNYGRGFTTDRGRKDTAPAHHIQLDRLHVVYANHFTDFTGWSEGQWVQTSGVVVSGSDHVMSNSVVEYTAGNGILVLGKRNVIENNIVHDTGYPGVFSAGICMGMESFNYDTIVRHNTVWANAFDSIMCQRLFSTRKTSPSRVHHNRVSDFGLMLRDVGGIKVVGHDPKMNGTRWDHNYVSDGGPWSIGLYQDYSGSHVLDHNVAWDVQVGLNLNSGKHQDVVANTLLGYRRGMTGGAVWRDRIFNNGISSIYSMKYFKLQETKASNNIEGVDASMFRDPATFDWRPKAGAPLIDAGTAVQGFTAQGVDKPDVGAYQQGEELWKVGSSLPHPTAAPSRLMVRRNAKGQPVLKWTDNADNEAAYYVERALRPTPQNYWRLFEVVVRIPANSTTWTDSSDEARFNSGHYRVRADHSMLSNTVEASAPGLIARYDFEQNLTDSAATLAAFPGRMSKGDASYVQDARSGTSAIVFQDRKKQVVEIADALGLTPGDAVTITFWMKPTRWPGGNRVVFRKGDRKNPTYSLYGHGSSLRFSVGRRTAELSAFPPENAWTHVACTFDGVRIRLYINGKLENEATERWGNPQGIPQSSESLRIGGPGGDSASSHFNGMIDDFRIYADIEMSAEQIKQIKNER